MGFLSFLFGTKESPGYDIVSQCFADTYANFVGAVNPVQVSVIRDWSIERRLLPEIRRRLPDPDVAELQFIADLKSNLNKKGYSLDIIPEFIQKNKNNKVGWLIDYIKVNAKKT